MTSAISQKGVHYRIQWEKSCIVVWVSDPKGSPSTFSPATTSPVVYVLIASFIDVAVVSEGM
eukprot:11867899-Ditylum_brightwellii.AAC.1